MNEQRYATDFHAISLRHGEVAVLVDQTLGLVLELLNDSISPPLLKVTVFVILSTFRKAKKEYTVLRKCISLSNDCEKYKCLLLKLFAYKTNSCKIHVNNKSA